MTEHVVCPENKKIEVHVYLAEANENLSTCTFTISPQTVKGFDISNEVKEGTTLDTLTATGEANIVGERHGLCGKTELYNTKQTINFMFSGTSAAGAKEGITLTD